jgi:hypothetical protein
MTTKPAATPPDESASATAAADSLPDFPSPSAPLADSNLREKISWADYLDETAWHLQRFLKSQDDADLRLARKSRTRFSL